VLSLLEQTGKTKRENIRIRRADVQSLLNIKVAVISVVKEAIFKRIVANTRELERKHRKETRSQVVTLRVS
jgi:hypothetical protein